MKEPKENVIEWLEDSNVVTLSLSQRKYMTKVRKLKQKYPDLVEINREPKENGGYMLAHIPLSCIKLNRPSKMTEEEKEELVNSLPKYR